MAARDPLMGVRRIEGARLCLEYVVAALVELRVRVAEPAPRRPVRSGLDVRRLLVSAQMAMRFVHDASSLRLM
jgi:hypothetical protein